MSSYVYEASGTDVDALAVGEKIIPSAYQVEENEQVLKEQGEPDLSNPWESAGIMPDGHNLPRPEAVEIHDTAVEEGPEAELQAARNRAVQRLEHVRRAPLITVEHGADHMPSKGISLAAGTNVVRLLSADSLRRSYTIQVYAGTLWIAEKPGLAIAQACIGISNALGPTVSIPHRGDVFALSDPITGATFSVTVLRDEMPV